MRHIATHGALSVRQWSLCLLVPVCLSDGHISTLVSSANTDEQIEMLCGWQICIGPMNYVLRGMQNGATLRMRLYAKLF